MNTRTIMLVEDNPGEESLTQRGLHKAGWGERTVVLRDGAAAPEMLKDMAPLPYLVLPDLKLPKPDGAGELRQIRSEKHTRHLRAYWLNLNTTPVLSR